MVLLNDQQVSGDLLMLRHAENMRVWECECAVLHAIYIHHVILLTPCEGKEMLSWHVMDEFSRGGE